MKVVNLKQISQNTKNAPTSKTETSYPHSKWTQQQKEKCEKVALQSNKQNEDFDWLQKIVNQFSAYKHQKQANANKQQLSQLFEHPRIACNDRKILSHIELTDNKNACKSQRKVMIDSAIGETKNDILQNNLTFAKNGLRPIPNTKNRRSQSERAVYKKSDSINNNIQTEKTKVEPVKIKMDKKFSDEQKQTTSSQLNRKNKNKNQCEHAEVKADLAQVKAKLSMPDKNPCRDGNKAAIVKETRKNFIHSIAENKNCFGRIVKNTSLELKQRSKLNRSSGNLNIKQDARENSQIEQLLSRKIDRTNQQKVQYQKDVPKVKLVQHLPEIYCQQKSEVNNAQIIQTQTQDEKQLKRQSGKKFNYLSEKSLQTRYDKICNKRQRKLNSSFGEKKIIYNDNIKLKTETQNERSSKYLRPSNNQDRIMVQAFSPSQFRNAYLKSNDKTDCQKSVLKQVIAQPLKREVTFSNRTLEQKVKLVESTKNSMILTEHSIVIEKEPVKASPLTCSKEQQWNILDIFQKLDRKNMGILAANNCAIENVSRQIRYILGTVLEEILYRDIQYSLINFITRVEQSLETIKQSEIISKRSGYQISKHKPDHLSRGLYRSPFQQQKSLKCSLSPLSHSHSSKKYEYTKLFVIDDVCTEPALVDRTSCRNAFASRQKKIVRFATFQNERDEFEHSCDKYGKSKNEIINLKEKQIKLEQKLKQLNEFKATDPLLLPSSTRNNVSDSCRNMLEFSKQTAPYENYSSVRPRSRSYTQPHQNMSKNAESNEYRNEIVKLELLNQRLERYLHDQSMKEFSADKLFA